MAIIKVIGVTLDLQGELVFNAGSDLLDPATVTWSTSADGGVTWQDYTWPEGGLPSTDADPALLYRLQDMTQETYQPLYHERTFSYGFDADGDDVIPIIKLTQAANDTQQEAEIRVALDATDAFEWTTARTETYRSSANESILGDDGFETFSNYSRTADGAQILQAYGTRDALDQRDWDTKWTPATQYYGENELHTTYDDGRYRLEFETENGSYPTEFGQATGPTRTVRWEDGGDAHAWETRETIYAEGMRVMSQTGYDNGIITISRYTQDAPDVLRVTTQSIDNDNTFNWDTTSAERINGQLSQTSRHFDDGTSQFRAYEYDESGLTLVQSLERDGTERTVGYEDGVRVGYSYIDQQDTHAWDTQVMQREGEYETRQIIYDDGVERVTELQNNQLVSVIVDDVEDAHAYTSIATFYEAGTRAETIATQDNGTEIRTSYGTDADGASIVTERSTVVLPESADSFVWREIAVGFDENGDKSDRFVDFVDGRLREETFSDGQLDTRLTTDRYDAYNWHTVDEVWEDGIRTSRVVTYDDEIA